MPILKHGVVMVLLACAPGSPEAGRRPDAGGGRVSRDAGVSSSSAPRRSQAAEVPFPAVGPSFSLVAARRTTTAPRAILHVGGIVQPRTRLRVASTGRTVLKVGAGDRIEAQGGTELWIGDTAPGQLLLALGVLQVNRPATQGLPAPAVRIVTPDATVEVSGPAKLWVATFRDGRGWFAVLSGSVEVAAPSVVSGASGPAEGRALVRRTLQGGQAVAFGSTADPVIEPLGSDPSEVERELAAMAATHGAADVLSLLDPIRRAALWYDEAAAWVDDERARGQSVEGMGRAPLGHEPAEGARAQKVLIDGALRLYSARRAALVRWENLEVRLAHLTAADPAQAALLQPLVTERRPGTAQWRFGGRGAGY